ncbi:pentapeptide repeat-containing protein [Paenarthrobacter sp. NPDC089714]|uniref:pentapeptide repeat-containing protein n=1 Tax=Paenarthrobacter sp. NPDC089714 TaxID=3364377 RepID=UPI0037FCE811
MTISPIFRPDCGNCFALCCTALGFARSADFAIDKAAAAPCPNMAGDFSCTIHDRLRPRGFSGCTVFDCFGAGQVVSQQIFRGVSWTDDPSARTSMFAVFKVVRQLHEMLWYLEDVPQRTYDPERADVALQLSRTILAITGGDPAAVVRADVERLHGEVRRLLLEVSEEVRGSYGAEGSRTYDGGLRPGADLAGAELARRRLCGADLRGAVLIAADLRASDLAAVDLLGADLRGARLENADVSLSLYLTQQQLNAAEGNGATLIPARLERPGHWG